MLTLLMTFFSLTASYAHDIQAGECLGNPRDPIVSVYLPGMYPDSDSAADPNHFRELEQKNRDALEKIARRLGIRIAVPLPPFTKKLPPVGQRYWTSSVEKGHPTATDAQIRKLVKKACGESAQKPTMLIGFSNGGNMARVLCQKGSEDYSRVVAIGWNNDDVSADGCDINEKLKDHHGLGEGNYPSQIQHELQRFKQSSAGRESGSDFAQ